MLWAEWRVSTYLPVCGENKEIHTVMKVCESGCTELNKTDPATAPDPSDQSSTLGNMMTSILIITVISASNKIIQCEDQQSFI